MADDDKLQTAITLGAQADSLMRSEVLQKVFTDLDRGLIEAWRTLPVRDTEGREKIWQAVNILGKVREALGRISADGRHADRQVQEAIARLAGGKKAAA